MLAEGAQALGHLLLDQHTEPEAFVVRSVPRHLGVGGERQPSQVMLLSPAVRGVE